MTKPSAAIMLAMSRSQNVGTDLEGSAIVRKAMQISFSYTLPFLFYLPIFPVASIKKFLPPLNKMIYLEF
ncbi:hypothetical protein [Endozoicomonas lisbonensis]|uniref:Uncharacterized protein n=1 Tax=Endozoicomonas lisbonensis TaxID=3120522 RepID=A0ABV2SCZ2_9GAMM